MRAMNGLMAFLIAAGFAASPASAQTVTILSQTVQCSATNLDGPEPRVQCLFNVLIIDPASDRRVSCGLYMVQTYKKIVGSGPPPTRLVNPTFPVGRYDFDCFIQPGLGIPHSSITDISNRGMGQMSGGVPNAPIGPNAYIIYTPNKITLCMNSGSLLPWPSETACKDANIHPF